MAKPYTLKKGDRVQITDLVKSDPDGFLEVGDRGTLTEDDTDGAPYVKWDEKFWDARNRRCCAVYCVYSAGLEKIND